VLASQSGSVRYEPTEEDRLWLLRAVEQEGAPEDRVAQTLVNGFVWARSELGYRGALADWVRAYAQPVNPKWFTTGEKHVDALARATTDAERNKLRQKAYAREHVHSVRTSFSPLVKSAVEKALTRPPELREATDYAAAWVEKKPPWKPLTDAEEGLNRFWVRPGAVGWLGYGVGLTRSNEGQILVILFAAAAAYVMLKGKKA
jgi:hypothetical protein